MFKWGVLATLLLAVSIGAYFYIKIDSEIARYAQQYLSEHYSHLDVQIAGARYDHGAGIIITGVTIAQPQPAGPPKPLLVVQELRLIGAIKSSSLSTGRPRIDRVELHRAQLSAVMLKSGHWNFEALSPPPKGDGPPAPLHIYDATVHVSDESKPDAKPLTLRNVSLALNQTPGEGGVSRIDIQGRAEDSLAQLVELKGFTDSRGEVVDIDLNVTKLGLTTERLLSVPGLTKAQLAGVTVNGQANINTKFQRKSLHTPLGWRCDFQLNRCTLTHPLLQKPMTGVELSGDLDSNWAVRIRQAKAKSGEAELTGVLTILGWGPQANAWCKFSVNHLALGPDLYRSLPDSMRGAWDRFDPKGEIDAAGELRLQGGRVWSDVQIQGRGLSMEDKKRFPYRIDSGTGSLRLVDKGERKDSRLIVQIDAQAEGQPVAIRGNFTGLPYERGRQVECPVGVLTITGNRFQVTERLLSALKAHPEAETAIRKLHPEGEFGLNWSLRRDTPTDEPYIAMDMLVHDGAVRFDHFRYPVRNIRGMIQQRGKRWTFSQLTSQSEGAASLSAAGVLDATGPRPVLALQINGVGAPLDATLRAALPADHQQAWKALRPTGRIDFNSTINYTVGDPKPSLAINVRPHGDSVSFVPEFFPYRMERLRGEFVMRGDEVRFYDARAQHGATRFLADGLFRPLPDGGWQFDLTDMSIDRLNVGADFSAAAPYGLRKVINRLQPEGGLAVHHGKLSFTQGGDSSQPLHTHWDLQIDCQQLDINAGVEIEDLYGTIGIVGDGVGDTGVSKGELRLDNMLWNGIQLTNVTGPLYCDKNECVLGRGASRFLGARERSITASAYGGVASIDARAQFQSQLKYATSVSLDSIDLARFDADYLHSRANLSGKLNGKLELRGTGSKVHGLAGSGNLAATDVNLYELPLLISMLKVLRNRPPDDTTAFDTVDATFTLQGEHIAFQELKLEGDAISLYGRGEARLDRNVNLVFHTLVGRNGLIAPVRALVGQASEQFLKLRVTGPIENAVVTREALPLVGNVFQQLQKDLTPRALTRPSEPRGAAAQRR